VRELALNLDDSGGATLTERIARAIEKAIRSGRLKPGTLLPGSRSLAEDLGVNRSTVISALNELTVEGWLVSERWRGTFVAPRPPMEQVPLNQPPRSGALGFELPSQHLKLSTGLTDVLNLRDGFADSCIAPREEMSRAYQRAMKLHGDKLLDRGEPQGNALLREMLAAWVSERHGLTIGADRIIITRGSRSGFRLVCDALLKLGDRVAVEEPGNREVWEALARNRKVDLCPIRVDAQGLVPESLEEVLAQGPVRLLYATPRCQFPTNVILDAGRAKRLLELAAQHRIAIFEDDSDAELHLEERRTLSLMARDTTGQVIFGASLSRLVAPGTRLGYLVVPAPLVPHITRLKHNLDTQGDRVSEWAFADLMRDDVLARHVRRARRVYEGRRTHLSGLLRQELGTHLVLETQASGTALWLKGRPPMDFPGWVQKARKCGVILSSPNQFFLGPPEPATRMGFSQVDESHLTEAVHRLKQALLLAE